jgi:hypothetical protein
VGAVDAVSRLTRYVALGDSFTAGAAGLDVPSFGDRLAEILRGANPRLDYVNLAASGARTTEVSSASCPPLWSWGPMWSRS